MVFNIKKIGSLKFSYFTLVVVAISITPGLMHILPAKWRFFPAISLATTLFFGLSILLEKYLWKLKPDFYGTENLSGLWEGVLVREGLEGDNESYPITYRIRQSLLDIVIQLKSDGAVDTQVISASIEGLDSGACLTYVYRGKNRNRSTGAIDIVEGTAILFQRGKRVLEGYYFTHSGRRGVIKVERKGTEIPHGMD